MWERKSPLFNWIFIYSRISFKLSRCILYRILSFLTSWIDDSNMKILFKIQNKWKKILNWSTDSNLLFYVIPQKYCGLAISNIKWLRDPRDRWLRSQPYETIRSPKIIKKKKNIQNWDNTNKTHSFHSTYL